MSVEAELSPPTRKLLTWRYLCQSVKAEITRARTASEYCQRSLLGRKNHPAIRALEKNGYHLQQATQNIKAAEELALKQIILQTSEDLINKRFDEIRTNITSAKKHLADFKTATKEFRELLTLSQDID